MAADCVLLECLRQLQHRLHSPGDRTGYDSPGTNISRQALKALGPKHELGENLREAHHVAVEDRIVAGAGATSQILSGGNMTLAVTESLLNQYGDIKARGWLDMSGAAAVRNEGATLYRTHSFDGYWYDDNRDKTYYKHGDISEIIGSARGVIHGDQGVSIRGRSFTNVDVSAGTVGNIRNAVQVIGSGQSGAGSAGANAAAGYGGGAVSGHVTGGGSGNGAVLAGAQSASAGSSLATAGPSSASGVQNQFAGGGATGASGAVNGASAHGAAGASGVSNDGQSLLLTQVGAGQGANGAQGNTIGEVRNVAPGGLFLQN